MTVSSISSSDVSLDRPAGAAGPRPAGWGPLVRGFLVIFAGYLALACLALSYVADREHIAQFWPANGLTLGVLLVARRRLWPGVIAATALANLVADLIFRPTSPVVAMAGFTVVNAGESLLAAAAMWAFFRRPLTFESVRDVIGFTVVACGLASSVAALGGATVAGWIGAPSFWDAWRMWVVVDALGLLTVVPVVVTAYRGRRTWPGLLGIAEATACVGGLAAACCYLFAGGVDEASPLWPIPYVAMLPFLLWAGLRFDPRVAAVVALLLVTITTAGTLHGYGPVARGEATSIAVVTAQFAGALWSVSALVLAAVTAERTAAAAALADSERRARIAEADAVVNHSRLQAVFDHSSSLIFMKDRDGRYIQVNRGFERHLGRPASEVLGKTDYDLTPKAFADDARAKDLVVLTTGTSMEYEAELNDASGRRVYQAAKFPVVDAEGAVTAVCVVATDVSRRRMVEDELRKARDDAEALREQSEASREQAEVARSQAETLRELAEVARADAEAASRAKSEFLANISHEIRTPLTSIFGYADLLLGPHVEAAERIEHVHTIRRNGEHLLAILNDVLDMSKIEAGRMTVEQVPCDVPRLVAEVLSLVRQKASARKLRLTVACRSPVPTVVESDPTRLRQVLLNILGNAVKFTEAGGVAVELAVEAPGGEEPTLVVKVSDTGIGMAAEQVAALGQPFKQADPSHARRFGGSGLGMSISYRLAELMGGSIACRSQPGVGTTFSLRLPVGDLSGALFVDELPDITDPTTGDRAENVVSAAIDGAGVHADIGPADASAANVLVVEDSADTLRLILTYLRRAGLNGAGAENGRVAVDRAVAAWRSGRPYDLILMDVQMPEMDGLAATSLLRARGYGGQIVALTANAMESDRQRCLTAGCNGFLTKPIRQDVLMAAVRAYVGDVGHAAESDWITSPPADERDPGDTPEVIAVGDKPSGLVTERLKSDLADDPVVASLLPEYLTELADKAAALSAAAGRGDWGLVRRLAHQIKGSAGGYGYPALTRAAELSEAAAESPDPQSAANPTENLVRLCFAATK